MRPVVFERPRIGQVPRPVRRGRPRGEAEPSAAQEPHRTDPPGGAAPGGRAYGTGGGELYGIGTVDRGAEDSLRQGIPLHLLSLLMYLPSLLVFSKTLSSFRSLFEVLFS